MTQPTAEPSRRLTERDLTALQGSLIAAFFVACIETQRHWPHASGLAFLLATAVLLGVWLAYLVGYKQAIRHAASVIDGAIISLVAWSWILSFLDDKSAASEMAATLLFWAPLISAWWAWRHWEAPRRLWPLAASPFVMPALLLSETIPVHAHVLLSLLVILAIRHPPQLPAPANSDAAAHLRDPITDLAAPEYFEAELAHLCSIADRYQMPVSLICCHLVDWHDESEFDPADIRVYSDMISERIRLSDTASRWEDNTFLLLLPNTTADSAALAREKIRFSLEAIRPPSGRAIAPVMAEVQHIAGDDPMSTLSQLEKKMVIELERLEQAA